MYAELVGVYNNEGEIHGVVTSFLFAEKSNTAQTEDGTMPQISVWIRFKGKHQLIHNCYSINKAVLSLHAAFVDQPCGDNVTILLCTPWLCRNSSPPLMLFIDLGSLFSCCCCFFLFFSLKLKFKLRCRIRYCCLLCKPNNCQLLLKYDNLLFVL